MKTALIPYLVERGIASGDGTNSPLARNELRLPLSLAVGFGAMFLAVALLLRSRSVRALNEAMPAAWLIRAQTYRMAGLMFVYPFLYCGVMPARFAVPAAAGDVMVGCFAPLMGRAVERGRAGWLRGAVAWNVLAVFDLIMAPAAAVWSHAQVIFVYPLALVALSAGPPLGVLTHIYSRRNLAAASRTARVGSSTSLSTTRRAPAIAGAIPTTE
jgi:hypothetical protein